MRGLFVELDIILHHGCKAGDHKQHYSITAYFFPDPQNLRDVKTTLIHALLSILKPLITKVISLDSGQTAGKVQSLSDLLVLILTSKLFRSKLHI